LPDALLPPARLSAFPLRIMSRKFLPRPPQRNSTHLFTSRRMGATTTRAGGRCARR
jgi:hypothetical protein